MNNKIEHKIGDTMLPVEPIGEYFLFGIGYRKWIGTYDDMLNMVDFIKKECNKQ
jgi:hypothetical protein